MNDDKNFDLENSNSEASGNGARKMFEEGPLTRKTCPYCGQLLDDSKAQGGYQEHVCKACGYKFVAYNETDLQKLYALNAFKNDAINLLLKKLEGGKKARIQLWQDKGKDFEEYIKYCGGDSNDDPLFAIARAAYLTDGFEEYSDHDEKIKVKKLYSVAKAYARKNPKAINVQKMVEICEEKLIHRGRGLKRFFKTAIILAVISAIVAFAAYEILYKPDLINPIDGQDGKEAEIIIPSNAIDPWFKLQLESKIELQNEGTAAYDTASNALRGIADEFVVYNIELSSMLGNVSEFKEPVTVILPLPEGYGSSPIRIYHVTKKDGRDSYDLITDNPDVNTTNGTISFKTSHFSWFVIVEKQPVVSFESNGGTSIEKQPIGSDGVVTKPADPTKAGFVFAGWFDSDGKEWDFKNDKVSKHDITLYAKWNPLINFNANGGEGTMSPLEIKNGNTVTLPTNTFTRAGYKFVGWSATPNGEKYRGDGEQYTYSSTSPTTLYAIWIKANNTVSFDANGGQGAIDSITAETGSIVTALPHEGFTRAGYKFMGWSKSPNGKVDYEAGSRFTIPTENVTLYAVWEGIEYKVVFHANGGYGSMEEMTFKTGATKNLLLNEFYRDGYTFKGWAVSSDGEVKYNDGVAYTMPPNGEVLYAVWEANQNQIIFNPNKGTGTMEPQKLATDATAKLNANTFVRKGYTFLGWSTYSNASSPDYVNGADYTMGTGSSYTLYAVWQKNTYKLTYETNGGSTCPEQSFTIENYQSIKLATTTRTGYDFAGWYLKADFSGDKVTSVDAWDDANVVLYAKWTPKTFTVTLDPDGAALADTKLTVTFGEKPKLPTVTKVGYTFEGWYNGDTKFDSSVAWNYNGNLTLKAKWTVSKYDIVLNGMEIEKTVTFNYNYSGASTSKVTVAKGGTLAYPTAPSRSGYIFTGWYTDSACTKFYSFNGELTSNLTLYAGWVKMYSSGVNNNLTLNPLTYPNSSSTYSYNNSASSTYQNYIYLVANETGTHNIYFRNDNANSSYRYYLGITNLTTGKAISETTLYEFNAGYNNISFSCNAGDVIVINFYRYSSNTYLYFYFGGFTDATKGKLTNGSTHTVVATYNENYTLPTPVKTGYTFGGWFDAKGNEVKSGKWTALQGISLTAKWTANTNKITLDLNGGSLSSSLSNIITVTYDKAFTLPTPTRTGHTFEGWYNGDAKLESGTWKGAGDLTLKAKWTASVYNVTLNGVEMNKVITFDYNYSGTTPSKVTVKPGETLAYPSIPARSYYVFTGWYTDKACTKIYSFNEALTSDMTLYAGWMPYHSTYYNAYTLTTPHSYNSSSYTYSYSTSSSSANSQNYLYLVAKETGTHNIYFRAGSSGDSYRPYLGVTNLTTNTTIEATSLRAYNASYTKISFTCNAGDVIAINFYRSSSSTTLYFYFEGFTNVTSAAKNGDVHVLKVEYDSILTLPIPTKTGMQFDGWNTKADGKGTKYESGKWTTMSDVVLYTTWSVQKNKITLEVDGGKVDSTTINVEYGKAYTLPTPTKTGYTFDGWYDADGNKVSGGTWQSYSDIKLYAKWTPYTSNVTFNDTIFSSKVTYNYNYGTTPSTTTYTVSGTSKLSYPSMPSRSGYIFTGWYTEPECKNFYNFSGHIYSDMTLYAGWMETKTGYYSSWFISNPYSYTTSSTYVGGYSTSYTSESKPNIIYVVANETGAHNIYFRSNNSGANYDNYIAVTNLTTGKVISASTLYDYNSNFDKVTFECNAGDVIAITYYRANTSYSTYLYFYFTGFKSLTSTAVSAQAQYSKGSISTLTMSYGETVAFGNVTRTGYNFAGWKNGDTKIENGKWTIMSDVTLTANWTPKTNKITFDTDGGKLSSTTMVVTYDAKYELPIPTKAGYTFGGWYNDNKLVENGVWTSTDDLSLKAKWSPAVYDVILKDAEFDKTIKFEYNYSGASTWKTVSVQKGGTLTYPGNPSRSGYVFTGWYLDKECKNRYNFTGNLPGEITLYAGWVAVSTPYYNYWFGDPVSYNSSSSYCSYNNSYTSETQQNYLYIVANESGAHKIYFKNNSSGTSYNYYIGITNITTGKVIRATQLQSYSSGFNSVSFECNAGDVIQINFYRSTSYNSTLYFYFEGFTKATSTAKNADVHSIPVVYGSAYSLPTPTRTGYTFLGWYDAAGKKVENGTWTATSAATYTAKWSVITNKITLDADGGKLDSSSLTVEYGKAYTLPTPTKTGYTFLGWYTDKDVKFESGTSWTTLQDMSLKAKWTINTYNFTFKDTTFSSKITYNYNYGTNPSTSVVTLTGNNKLSYPSIPSRSGYMFTGWYTDAECKNFYNFTGPITSDLTLYAGWIATKTSYYNQVYNYYPANSTSSSTYGYGTGSSNATYQNYMYLLANETGKHTIYFRNSSSGTSYQYYLGVTNLTTDKSISATNLYSYDSTYKSITFECKAGDVIMINFYRYSSSSTVYFYFEGFSNINSNATSVQAQYSKGVDSTITLNHGDMLTLTSPVRTGYTFGGWFDAAGKKIESGKWTTLSGANLTAKWTANTNKITLDANGGTVSPSSLTVTYDANYTLPTPIRTGYKFEGWHTDEDVKVENGKWTGTEDITLIAKWTPLTYTVTFNDTTFSSKVTFNYNYTGGPSGYTSTISGTNKLGYPSIPSRSGYVFTGWYTDAECKNFYDFKGHVYSDMTLYAGWKAVKETYNSYNIVYPYNYISSSNRYGYAATNTSEAKQNYIYFVANETGTHSIYFTSYYSDKNYDTYVGVTNLTTGKTISATALYDYNSSYDKIKFTCNAGDVIVINFYRSNASYSNTLYFYFNGFKSITSTAVSGQAQYSKGSNKALTISYDEMVMFNTITRTGYTFGGWLNGTTEVKSGKWTTMADVTLTQNWIAKTNKLTFNADGGTLPSTIKDSAMIVTYDAEYVLPVPTKPGYEFVGWYDVNGNVLLDGTWARTADVALKAKWIPATYKLILDGAEFDKVITFDYNYSGKSPLKVTVKKGETLPYPSIPSISGYIFTGWYMDKECENRFMFTEVLPGNITLYAGWMKCPDSYQNAFLLSNPYSYNSADSTTYNHSTNYTSESRQNYLYVMANESGTHTINFKNVNSGTYYQYYLGVTNVTTGKVIKETTLYSYDDYYKTVSFECNAGDLIQINFYRYNTSYSTTLSLYFEGFTNLESTAKNSTMHAMDVTYLSNYTLPKPEKTGYTFDGWYDGDKKVTDGQWTATSGTTLAAKWTANKYTITFNPNSGAMPSGTTNSMEIAYGADYKLPTPTKTGYSFLGWFNGDTKIEQSGKWTTTSNLTLKAKWEVNTYEITFKDTIFDATVTYVYNYENAPASTTKQVSLKNGEVLAYPTDIPTRSGYVFTGWYLDKECKNRYNFTGDIITDFTLYAGWVETATVIYGSPYIVKTPVNYTSVNSYSVPTDSASASQQKYVYVVANETGSHTIYFYNNSSTYGYYLGITNLSTNTMIQSTAHYNGGTTAESVTFDCKAGDVIQINLYRDNGSSRLYFYFEGFSTMRSDASVPSRTCVVGAEDKQSIKYGDSITLTTPTREGYGFEGWYYGDIKVESGVWKYASDVTLVAKWTKFSEGFTVALNPDNKSYSIAGKENCTESVLVIPETIDGLPVTGIASEAFKDCTSIVSVILPTTVTSIGANAFYNCTALKGFNTLEYITNIGENAFYGCTNLVLSINVKTNEMLQDVFACGALKIKIKVPAGDSIANTGTLTLPATTEYLEIVGSDETLNNVYIVSYAKETVLSNIHFENAIGGTGLQLYSETVTLDKFGFYMVNNGGNALQLFCENAKLIIGDTVVLQADQYGVGLLANNVVISAKTGETTRPELHVFGGLGANAYSAGANGSNGGIGAVCKHLTVSGVSVVINGGDGGNGGSYTATPSSSRNGYNGGNGGYGAVALQCNELTLKDKAIVALNGGDGGNGGSGEAARNDYWFSENIGGRGGNAGNGNYALVADKVSVDVSSSMKVTGGNGGNGGNGGKKDTNFVDGTSGAGGYKGNGSAALNLELTMDNVVIVNGSNGSNGATGGAYDSNPNN